MDLVVMEGKSASGKLSPLLLGELWRWEMTQTAPLV